MSNLWVTPEELGAQADSEYAYEACKTASFLLWGMSGRKFSGVTSVTEIYQQTLGGSFERSALLQNQSSSYVLFESMITSARTGMSIRLKGRPVSEVTAVRVGGEFLNPDEFYLTDHANLKFFRPVSGNIEVTYTYGQLPPTAGRMAARMLAQQFALMWEGSDECTLPDRVTSVSREGISYTILDQQDFVADLRTGVYAVDLFLKTVNPDRALKRAKVFSPDVPRGKRPTAKLPLLPKTDLDIVVSRSAGYGQMVVSLDDISAEFLASETGWTPELVLHSNGGRKALTLENGVGLTNGNLTVTVQFDDALTVIGSIDPGVWDLYAAKNGASTHIASGNLSARMS